MGGVSISSIENMLKQADFSKETDLKDRLRARLFSKQVVQFPGRRTELDDDLLDLVSAAGVPVEDPETQADLRKLFGKDLPGKDN